MIAGPLMRHDTSGRIRENSEKTVSVRLGTGITSFKLTDQQKQRADRLGGAIDAKAKAGADEFLPKIRQNVDNSWIDGFLAYRDDFALADGAREAIDAFESLRKQHEPEAQRAFGEARAAFQQGKPDQAYAKYQEIVDKDYASSLYRNAKQWLKSRK
jgi:hypothetical protein